MKSWSRVIERERERHEFTYLVSSVLIAERTELESFFGGFGDVDGDELNFTGKGCLQKR
jgi:hypothetical protein